METLSSALDPQSPEFKANAEHNRALASELKKRLALVREGGGEKYRKRHEEQGKLFVRERIERLLDPGAPFLELSALAAWNMYKEKDSDALTAPSAGIVTSVPWTEPAGAAGAARHPRCRHRPWRGRVDLAKRPLPGHSRRRWAFRFFAANGRAGRALAIPADTKR